MYIFYSKNPNFFTSAHLPARPIFQGKIDANQTINWLQPREKQNKKEGCVIIYEKESQIMNLR